MRTLKDDQRFLPGLEMLPLRIGAGQVGKECAVAAFFPVQGHRNVAGKRRRPVVSDECSKAVALHERCQLDSIIDAECGWNVHVRLIVQRSVLGEPELIESEISLPYSLRPTLKPRGQTALAPG